MIIIKEKKAYTVADFLIVLTILVVLFILIFPSLLSNKDDNIIDNTKIKTNFNDKKLFNNSDCKVQIIEITDNGVSIKCKE